jgi:hypothetical protein
MKTSKLFQALLVLSLLACSSAVQGQYNSSTVALSNQFNTTTVAYPANAQSATTATAQYAQFYSMNTGPTPSNLVSVPQPYNLTGYYPTTVYFSNQMQSVPFSQYQANPTYGVGNSLWIKGSTAWSQYAAVPVGANVPLLAISPSSGGSGLLNVMDSTGQTYSYNYFFYPGSLLSFYAANPGRYTLTFAIGGMASNPVVIDVAGTLIATYNPYNPNLTYAPVVNTYNNPQAALDIADATKAYQQFYNQQLYNGNYYGVWHYYAYDWLNAPT